MSESFIYRFSVASYILVKVNQQTCRYSSVHYSKGYYQIENYDYHFMSKQRFSFSSQNPTFLYSIPDLM